MTAPIVRTDASDWAEDFDIFQETDGFQLYYNLHPRKFKMEQIFS